MIRINLLPHRQMQRAARQREFILLTLLALALAFATIFLVYIIIDGRIATQIERNQRLNAGIAKLDKEIADIGNLKQQINSMLTRKQVVESLQTKRNQTVAIFNELNHQLPDGVLLTSFKQKENVITVEGVADSNAKIATLVRNFSNSNWLQLPTLIEIKTISTDNVKQNTFVIKVNIRNTLEETSHSHDKSSANSGGQT